MVDGVRPGLLAVRGSSEDRTTLRFCDRIYIQFAETKHGAIYLRYTIGAVNNHTSTRWMCVTEHARKYANGSTLKTYFLHQFDSHVLGRLPKLHDGPYRFCLSRGVVSQPAPVRRQSCAWHALSLGLSKPTAIRSFRSYSAIYMWFVYWFLV